MKTCLCLPFFNFLKQRLRRRKSLSLNMLSGSFLFLIFYVYEGLAQKVPIPVQKPLKISSHNVILGVGSDKNITLSSTLAFEQIFSNTSSAILILNSTKPELAQITPSNLTLVLNGIPVFSKAVINVRAIFAGKDTVRTRLVTDPELKANVSVENIFIRISIYKSAPLLLLSSIIGWIYFFAWIFSFFPQIHQNWKRKSVRGLSLDFVFLNVTGFLVYGIFNIGLFWIPEIQEEYFQKYPTGVIPVQSNDLVFSLLAIFASSTTLTQCLIYDKGSQTVSKVGRTLLGGIYTFLTVILIVTLSGNVLSWLTFLSLCSYVKVFITLIKYIPQAYLNWSRKSTSGWAIGNVLLDFTGGIFSIMQMLIISYNHDDWISIFGDFTKFALGFISVSFDILFMIQHYCLYNRNRDAYEYEPIDGSNIPGPINHIHNISGAPHGSMIVEPVDPYEDMVTSGNQLGNDEDEQEQEDLQAQDERRNHLGPTCTATNNT